MRKADKVREGPSVSSNLLAEKEEAEERRREEVRKNWDEVE